MKKALITGATGAIGESCARYFHKNGYFVYLHYRSQKEKAVAIHNELPNSTLLQFDITDRMAVHAALTELTLDVLVNNAGITRDNLFFWMTDDEWDSVINTSINGTYNVTKSIMKNMIANKCGTIINIASISGISGNMGQTNYSAAKGALISFTKALSMELARYKIRVNCVAPGLIESEMTEKLNLIEIKKTIPLKRIGEPHDVAECVYFLADKASYVTGEVLNISGGLLR